MYGLRERNRGKLLWLFSQWVNFKRQTWWNRCEVACWLQIYTVAETWCRVWGRRKQFFCRPTNWEIWGGRRETHCILELNGKLLANCMVQLYSSIFYHCWRSLKISSKSVPNFLTYVEHRQADKRDATKNTRGQKRLLMRYTLYSCYILACKSVTVTGVSSGF